MGAQGLTGLLAVHHRQGQGQTVFIVPVGPLVYPETHLAAGPGFALGGGGEGNVQVVEISVLRGLFLLRTGQEREGDAQKVGGGTAELQLVQLGGASGRLASPAQLDTQYTYKGMKGADLTAIGSGAILVVDERTSVIGFLRMTQQFFSHESCGQCTPCREGNRHIARFLDKIAAGAHTEEDIKLMEKYADIMSTASMCGLGETAQSALLSAMKRFPEVFAVKKEVAVR